MMVVVVARSRRHQNVFGVVVVMGDVGHLFPTALWSRGKMDLYLFFSFRFYTYFTYLTYSWYIGLGEKKRTK